MARGAICICEGGRRNVKISSARVGVQDSNTIAAAQRTNGLILDMAYPIRCLRHYFTEIEVWPSWPANFAGWPALSMALRF